MNFSKIKFKKSSNSRLLRKFLDLNFAKIMQLKFDFLNSDGYIAKRLTLSLVCFLMSIIVYGWTSSPLIAAKKLPVTTTVQLHFSGNRNTTTLNLNFKKRTRCTAFVLVNPSRLIIDMTQAQLSKSYTHQLFHDTLIKRIRIARMKKGKSRVIFDLYAPVKIQNIGWQKTIRKTTHPFIIQLRATKKVLQKTRSNAHLKHVIEQNLDRYDIHKNQRLVGTKLNSRSHNQRTIRVVIDPGHGGKDDGATGPQGYHEKNVVLAIGKDLAKLINKQPHFHAYLTRTGDYFVTLRGRLAIARKDKADMFIAIHADAFKERSAHGASVFALSQRGATSEAARWLAKRENESELGGVDLNNKSRLLKSVLIDLSQTATIATSLKIGQSIIQQLVKVTHLHNPKHRVEQASFVVLKSPDIPSLLVETGFISNPREEKYLINARYQHKIALALEKGIVSYFKTHPVRYG